MEFQTSHHGDYLKRIVSKSYTADDFANNFQKSHSDLPEHMTEAESMFLRKKGESF
jgi:hypothetical protein